LKKRIISTISLKLLFTLFAPIGSFPVRISEGVTKVHDATRVGAMRQGQGVAQLMNRFFGGALAEGLFICPDTQPK
jgi:hypothetical protein